MKISASNTGVCAEDPLEEGEIAIHLGSGRHRWDGWVNVDGFDDAADVKCDIKELWLPDNHADRMCAVHVFEHFYHWEVNEVLREWLRVLKPGGTLILELPCMNKVFGYICTTISKGEPLSPTFSWLPIWGDPRYGRPEMCHRWGYFKADMDVVLKGAGFENISHEEARYHFPIRDMRVTARKPVA